MIIPSMEELYKPYSKDASLEKTLEWLHKQAAANGVPDAIRDTVITEVFLEMAKGKTFSTTSCSCGCAFPVQWSCVDMNHYTLKCMIARKDTIAATTVMLLQKALEASILDHIHRENEKYVAEQGIESLLTVPDSVGGAGSGELNIPNGVRYRLTDWSRSPVLKAMNRVIRWTGSLLAL